jgi:hypothetical protein
VSFFFFFVGLKCSAYSYGPDCAHTAFWSIYDNNNYTHETFKPNHLTPQLCNLGPKESSEFHPFSYGAATAATAATAAFPPLDASLVWDEAQWSMLDGFQFQNELFDTDASNGLDLHVGLDPHVSDMFDPMARNPSDTSGTSLSSTSLTPSGANGRFVCTDPTCDITFKRKSDMLRHAKKHEPPAFHCYEQGCQYNGARGFYRKDKLVDHRKHRHGLA